MGYIRKLGRCTAVLAFFLFSISLSSFPADTIRKEIRVVKEGIHATQDIEEVRRLVQYLQFLEEIVRDFGVRSCDSPEPLSEPVIDDEFRKKLFRSLKWLDKNRDLKVSSLAIYELMKYVELVKMTNPPPQSQEEDKSYYEFESSDKSTKAQVRVDRQGNVLITFKDKILGKGAYKTVRVVTDYRTWTNVALHTSEKDEESLEELRNEKRFLEKIMSFDPANRRGLVETLSFSQNEIVQRMYDNTLKGIVEGTQASKPLVLSHEQRLEALSQLTDGMAYLHSQGIGHFDVKPANILASIDPLTGKVVMVWADFGKAHQMESAVFKKRRAWGTSLYMSPEHYRKEWPGEGRSEKVRTELALRADVFSHVLATYTLAHGVSNPAYPAVEHPLILMCEDQANREFDAIGNAKDAEWLPLYMKCRDRALNSLYAVDRNDPKYTSMSHLNLRALHPNPEKRISMDQYRIGVNHLKSKQSDTTTEISLDQITRKLSDVGIQASPMTRVQYESGFQKEAPGTYRLYPFKVPGGSGYRVGLTYVDQDNSLVSKVLDVSPSDPTQVRGEIEFLKKIGTLSYQLVP